ncbi:MAG TPA: M13 family metallopeptidase [Chitinophagaceae bacterium]|nr:M13 family metallopeptidase [Chitinophagaceae bacterium]
MKNSIYLLIAAAVVSCGLYSCQSGNHQSKDALDFSGRDTSVRPTQNFFQYANGDWVKNTKIPASKTGWGSFYIVRDHALTNMETILDSCQALKNPAKGSVAQQIGDLYASGMDSTAIEKAGLSPLKGDLDRIAAIKNAQDVLNVVTAYYTNGQSLLFRFYVSPDDKNSNVERAQFHQGGLGLPNRNYYFKDDSTSKSIRAAYLQYVTSILHLSGDSAHAADDAGAVIALETNLAKASKTPVDLRDPESNYHLLSLSDMDKKAPAISWKDLVKNLHIQVDTLLVGQPDFYQALSGLLGKTPVNVWRNYLTFHLISSYAAWLSKPFAEARFNFYNKLLNGQQEPEARWKRVSSLVNSELGDALGKLYVERFFPPEAKQYMMKLVNNLQDTYRERIKQNDWMSDSTKLKAVDKLNAYIKKIGYPNKWKDYSSIDISRSSLIRNLQNIGKWSYNYNIDKLGKPVDKTEWQMTPPTVNAYYNPSFNEIVFPAGILQPPFYFQHADDAVNYGAIGAVIGHEMTHGFDDQGSQYDKNGNLKNWWTKEDREKFEKRANQVVREYNQYTVLDSVHVNGKLTEGENIADIGGLAIAYAAFKNTPEGKSDTTIDGKTPDQRFFLSFAQIWRIKDRPQRLLWRINNDPHSPEMYRVNGPTSNMTAFYQAFNVKPGDKMYRPDSIRVHIW